MKFKLLLILVLACFSFQAFSQHDHAVKSDKGLLKISIMYPFAEGNTFNMDYYETKHMPYVAGLIGENLVKYTIEKGVSNGVPNSELPFMAIGIFYVKSVSAYQTAIGPNIAEIRADFANYTNVTPVILVSEVVK